MVSETVKLNNGLDMPLVGLGCWKIPNEVCASQVYEAIKLGYRLFDGAQDYGNEKQVGEGIRKAIDDGIVARKDLFVVSKLWNSYHDPKNVKSALKKTLSDMGLEYLDLFYIHFPLAFKYVPFEERYPPGFYTGAEDEKKGVISLEKVPILDTYRALEECVKEGLIKSIGISNFRGILIHDLLAGAKIPPVCLQIEHHPYLTQEHLIEYCEQAGIQVVAYSSFGPQSFIELDSELAKSTPTLFEHESVKTIANKHNVTASQVLLRWATQRGIAIIPKSSKKERLLDNLQINEKLTLTEAEVKAISALNKDIRFNDPFTWLNSKFPVFA
ncbi:LANO_0H22826g1_1 [Lachancea nothofagi CBS 11611]|uniref:LANO_0H22826g1_1 n=1 Tax=Lachancea nothofagi CBS 11611 TaxID=1266666 RepID=A0A1G4KNP4_9SACH|nr:LANO_0H22826g1_1 [Lachancea nothofagi CBS 11611]